LPPLIELIGAGAGASLLLTAGVWRLRTRRQAVRQVRLAMLDPDPGTRRAAMFVASERGLGPYADLLVERAECETDRNVVAAMAEAITRNQWEPADNRRLVDLRLWAQGQLATPAPNGANGNGSAPRPAAVVATRPRPRAAAGTASEPAPVPLRPPAEQGAEPGPKVERPPTPVVRRPSQITVLVTGAGGPAGVAVIRALMAAGQRVVAVDADGLAVGLRLAQRSAVLPRADDSTFIERLRELAFETGARALVSTVADELAVLARARTDLEDVGLETWVPDPAAVQACTDKWQFAQVLTRCHLAGPATNLGSAEGVPGPWIVKPRFGRGSRDVYAVDEPDGLAWVLTQVQEPIVQTRLRGREFTVDALVDRNGRLAGAVPRWRLETKAGISTKGRTFADGDLVAGVAELLASVGLQGPANVQGFVDADGHPVFIEVNPRFSGGLPLSLAAGADLVGEYVRAIFGEPVRADRLVFRPGVTMIRHFEERFE
jgi:carbamoyl-phosphate synthase large subunit